MRKETGIMFTLVTGGSASGKSEYAENILPKDGGRVYLATMEPFGKEAEARIARHRNLREGKGFKTVECPVNIVTCLNACSGRNVLLEDLPNLVANEIFRPDGNGTANILRQILELERAAKSLVCVTGILTADGRCYDGETVQWQKEPDRNRVYENRNCYDGETVKYLQELARIENALAQWADRVVEVVCGIGNVLKPDLPFDNRMKRGGHDVTYDADVRYHSPECHRIDCNMAAVTFETGTKNYSSEYSRTDRNMEAVKYVIDEGNQPSYSSDEMGGHKMIFVTGPMYSGKRSYIKSALGLSDAAFEERAVWNVEELVCGKIWEDNELIMLADKLAQKDIVIANETGCGVIPLEKSERERREWSGRLACMLAERADTVIRVVCGCPQILKGGA